MSDKKDDEKSWFEKNKIIVIIVISLVVLVVVTFIFYQYSDMEFTGYDPNFAPFEYIPTFRYPDEAVSQATPAQRSSLRGRPESGQVSMEMASMPRRVSS